MQKDCLPEGTKLKSGIREYEILSVLGQGGFGITYLAKANLLVDNIPIEALFAIKEHYISKMNERQGMSVVISNDNNRQEIKESIDSFVTEAKRLNKLSLHHPGIVRVNEIFKANDTAYYVMEYIKGYSVRKYVRQSKTGRLSEKEALQLFRPIAEAVGFLHKNKVTHLDIKPDNILIRENGQPVIIDFGLSKHYNSKGTPTSTTKAFGCSDGYSPMEQYAGITTFTPEADIYALAATLLYMLTGKDPQRSTEITPDIIRNSLLPNISDRTISTILKAMEKLKENRTSKVEELMSLFPHSDNSEETGTGRHDTQKDEDNPNGGNSKTRKFGTKKISFPFTERIRDFFSCLVGDKVSVSFVCNALTNVGMCDSNIDDFCVIPDVASGSPLFCNQEINLGKLGCVMTIADGIRASNNGDVASCIAIRTVIEMFSTGKVSPDIVNNQDSIKNYIVTVICEADLKIREHSKKDPFTAGMKTSVGLIWLLGKNVYVGWLGNCRAYSYSEEKRLLRLSKDHSRAQEFVDSGLITPEDAMSHPAFNDVTRCLGDTSAPMPAVISYKISRGEIIMLCSDGITSACDDNTIVDTLEESVFETIPGNLIDEALAANSKENLTIALLKITGM